MTTKLTFYRFGILFAALFGLLAAMPAAQATGGNNLKAIGLTQDGVLVRFTTGSGNTQDIGFISGLQGDTSLIGIDFRVQDGLLYGVGNFGGLYTINIQNAVATPVPAPVGPALDVALVGTFFGVDFNPAANALRIVSDTGQNLRHPFAGALQGQTQNDAGTPAIGLRYPPVPPAAAMPALGVTAAAYTNNDDAATGGTPTGTTLFDIDTVLDPNNPVDQTDVVVIQSPANSGNIVATGSLGVDAGPQAGFDIFSQLRKGVTVSNTAFASLFVNGGYRLYNINLLTGSAKLVGAFDDQVVDLAIQLKQ